MSLIGFFVRYKNDAVIFCMLAFPNNLNKFQYVYIDVPCTNGHILMPRTIKYTKCLFLVKLTYINFNQHINIRGQEKKRDFNSQIAKGR